MPKVSVIIPVYNAQEYLERCLDSVCGQSLQEIEIICVDDCSSDSSLEILQKYAKNYKNLIILHLEKNGGESAARNAGLALAKGEYLAFVDNDDELDLNFLEKLYQKAVEKNADIVKGEAMEIDCNGKKTAAKQIASGGDKWLFISYWWCAIYKRSMITENNIFFSEKHVLGGDLLFLNQAVIAAKNFQIVDGVFYNYYRREDSGDSKILSEEKMRSALEIFEMVTDNINEQILNSDAVYAFIFHHFIAGSLYLSLRSEEEKLKKLCAEISMNIFTKCRKKELLKINFLSTAPNLFIFLQSGDIEALGDVINKSKSRAELIVSGLRNRIKKNSTAS